MDEIAISGLNTMASVKVKPARIAEAAVQLECEVRSDVTLQNVILSGSTFTCADTHNNSFLSVSAQMFTLPIKEFRV